MNDTTTSPIQINGYHAHVYYDTATRLLAERLAETIGSQFPVEFGGFFDAPVGPHPIANLQIIFSTTQFQNVVPWLMLNRAELADDSVEDHSRYALWLGNPVTLRLQTLRRTYRPELLPTT